MGLRDQAEEKLKRMLKVASLPLRLGPLKSYMVRSQRRVGFDDLVDYLARNDTWERTCGLKIV